MYRNNLTIESCDLSNCIEFIEGEARISLFLLVMFCPNVCVNLVGLSETHFRDADSNLLDQ